MEELNRKISLWIREHLIPRLIKNESDVGFSIERPNENYYASDTFFLTLYSLKSGEKKILVKLPSLDSELSAIYDFNKIFGNETSFYKDIARGDDHYPQCYLAGKDPVFESIIVLEDVRSKGFTVSPKKVDVQLDYIIAALKAIASFHALTFELKEKESDRFRRIVKSLYESRFQEDPFNERLRKVVNDACLTLVHNFEARNPNSKFTTNLSHIFQDAFVNIIIKCVKPNEPLATIIHGDCTINNILYRMQKKKDEDSNLEAMLIDFGLMMYSSPIIDIATLLYMTCTREDIRDRAKYLLKVYHATLVECMKERGIWDATKYSLDSFWREYRQRAVFGYIIAAFFRGMMTDFEREHDLHQGESMSVWRGRNGGEQVANLLVDMLEDLLDAGMLEDFIEK